MGVILQNFLFIYSRDQYSLFLKSILPTYIIIILFLNYYYYLGRSSTSPSISGHRPLLSVSTISCQRLPGAKVPQLDFQFRRANKSLVYPFFFLTLAGSILLQSCSSFLSHAPGDWHISFSSFLLSIVYFLHLFSFLFRKVWLYLEV